MPPALQIRLDHHFGELLEAYFRFPTKGSPRLFGIADQDINLGRANELQIDPNQQATGPPIPSGLVRSLALPFDLVADHRGGQLHKALYAFRTTGRQDEVARLVLLQHEPHARDVIAGITPIAPGVQIAKLQD